MIFDPFGDFETRGYLRNVFAEKDPAIIKRLEHQAFRQRIGDALDALALLPSLRYRDVLETHQRLFGDVYPWAGQDRLAVLPDMAVGKAGRFDLFAHPQDLRRATEYALDLAQKQQGMAHGPGEVMGLLAHAHPFLDGNGRTIMTVHADLARRAGLHIAWAEIEKTGYLTALTQELEQPGAILDRFLAPYLRRGAVPAAEAAASLATNPGLGPVADRDGSPAPNADWRGRAPDEPQDDRPARSSPGPRP